VFDPASRTLELSSAGHPPPLIRRADGSVEDVALQQGPLLGFVNRVEPYPTLVCHLQPGELLLFYTDGVTEAPAPDHQMFGTERLRAALAQTPFPARLSQWTVALRQVIRGFTNTEQQEDDITLALLRVQ
jgi:sigma-B regulation protein RsbU (phosphoserine phosphatase)